MKIKVVFKTCQNEFFKRPQIKIREPETVSLWCHYFCCPTAGASGSRYGMKSVRRTNRKYCPFQSSICLEQLTFPFYFAFFFSEASSCQERKIKPQPTFSMRCVCSYMALFSVLGKTVLTVTGCSAITDRVEKPGGFSVKVHNFLLLYFRKSSDLNTACGAEK